jgi:hypothetical protein
MAGEAFPHVLPKPEFITRNNSNGALVAFQSVGLDASGNSISVNSNSTANYPPVGIALAAVGNNVQYTFLRQGIVSSGGFAFTPGKVYLSATGQPIQPAPVSGVVQTLGYALTSTKFFFQPDLQPIVL